MARKPFVVIDAEILSSSVWSEAASTKLVWLTLLILCDTEGYVGAALPGIATAAGVSLPEAEAAMRRLQEPDPYSRTQTNEGRRVEPAERGWRILNFREHIDRLSAERKKSRDRVRRFREKKRQSNSGNVTVTPGNREQGIGNRDKTEGTEAHPVRPVGQANPLLQGRRPDMEREGYRLIREIAALEPHRDPLEILMEAAGWETKDGRVRTKCRLETMTDDHLIRTVQDLKGTLEQVKADAQTQAKQSGRR